MKTCVLRKRVRSVGLSCDENECIFWSQLGLEGEPQCAVQYFKLLDAPGQELAEWLLSLKEGHEIEAALGIRRIGKTTPQFAD
jgi:hypothetical protein